MPIRKLLVHEPRDLIDSNTPLAVLRIAADLEFILFEKLHFEKQINPELMYKWTLGTYIKWCEKNELIDRKWVATLEKFNKIRNLIVHNRTVYNAIKRDSTKERKLREFLHSICNFMEESETKYISNQKLEKTYSQFFDKKDKEFFKIFNSLGN